MCKCFVRVCCSLIISPMLSSTASALNSNWKYSSLASVFSHLPLLPPTCSLCHFLSFSFSHSHTYPPPPHTQLQVSIQNAQIREQSHAPFSSITHSLVFPDFDPNISSCHHLSSPAHHLFSVSTASFHFLSFHSSSLVFILFLLMSAAFLSFPCLFPLCDKCERALLFCFFFSPLMSRIRTDPFHSTETHEDTSE